MVAKNALFIAAFALLLSPMLHADASGMGDWEGQLRINGSLAPDGTSVCAYVNGAENSRTTIGAYASGYYLMTVIGATGDNITFKVYCEYLVNEPAQNWSASPPRHRLNITLNHSNGPVLTRISPAATGVAAGTVTLTLSTNESATCRYATTSGVSYAGMSAATTTTLGTTHSWSISAPSASTAYYYYAKCIDQFSHVSDELSLSFTTAASGGGGGGGGSGGGSSSGGGSVGGGGGAGASTKAVSNYSVDIGQGASCKVTVTREMKSSTNVSVLTTTLENTGGSSCDLEDYYFADTIPDSFPAINEITFNPMYSARDGWKVTFNFPTFAGGESKTLTYSVNGWVGSSRVKNFTVYEMGAKKKTAAPTQPTTPTGQTTEQETPWQPMPKLPPAAPAANATQPIVQPQTPSNNFMSLVVTAIIVVVVLGGIGGLALYLKGRKKGM